MGKDPLTFTNDDWVLLEGLRERFLSASEQKDAYWNSERELVLYDQTFARRILWKVEAVFRDLIFRGWSPKISSVLDFGCGTGVMSESFLNFFPGVCREISVFDRSSLAKEFACRKLREILGGEGAVHSLEAWSTNSESLVLASHVLAEMTEADLHRFVASLSLCQTFVLVEAGTPVHAQRLDRIRELLRKEFRVLGPCPHQEKCPLSSAGVRDWCHNFASSPSEVFQSSFWNEFSRRLKIDLRVLPYSYLAMTKDTEAPVFSQRRQIGRARVSKGFARILWCGQDGKIAQIEHDKRANKNDFKKIKKDPSLLYL